MEFLKKCKMLFDNILAFATVVSLVCMMFTVIIQVFARFFLPQAPAWTEEASRIFFIYTSAFASGLALERKAFVSLGIIDHYCKGRMLFYVRLSVSVVSMIFAFLVAYVSLEFVENGATQTAPTLRFLTMDSIFISITIMMGTIGFYGILEVYSIITDHLEHKESVQ